MIVSAAMLLEWLGDRHGDSATAQAGVNIDRAIDLALAGGVLTRDLGGTAGTAEFTAAVLHALPKIFENG